MYWNDHSPPHFQAKYGDYEITVDINTGVVEGKFPKRALRHVLEWYELYKDELLEDWDLCEKQEMPNPVKPLE
ncbi:MAG: transcriptional regulator [Gammaproteobacteria bacterium]|nr:MAG: transcriptional regulator [Gammaproteobacteria bacterium]RKZ74861.1 MAG: transcriptional regulator [Gammaproteobacteria bacterium]